MRMVLAVGRKDPEYIDMMELGEELRELAAELQEEQEDREREFAENEERERAEVKANNDAFYRNAYRENPKSPLFKRKKQ